MESKPEENQKTKNTPLYIYSLAYNTRQDEH